MIPGLPAGYWPSTLLKRVRRLLWDNRGMNDDTKRACARELATRLDDEVYSDASKRIAREIVARAAPGAASGNIDDWALSVTDQIGTYMAVEGAVGAGWVEELIDEFVAGQSGEGAAEADPGDPFGRWAWPGDRKTIKRTEAGKEPNTPDENEAMAELQDYFETNTAPSRRVCRTIVDMLRAGKYSPVIHAPPPGTQMYRGIRVSGADVEDLRAKLAPWGITVDDAGRPDGGWRAVDAVHKNWRTVSGWSHAEGRGDSFGHPGKDKFTVGVVAQAACDDNPGILVDCVGGLYGVTPFAVYAEENEILAFGDVRVHSVKAVVA